MDSIDRRRIDAKIRGWEWVALQFDAMAYRQRVRAWLTHSAMGASDTAGVTVTSRSLGALTATLPDGSTREMFAPIPLA